ncbi:MAG: PAS domain-containing sensor histidine kinase, partial [Desulfobacteraceae bacterium]|nr:PAS domain-containing sensor histidine kinase [Desulfobacteraceae bacterium]
MNTDPGFVPEELFWRARIFDSLSYPSVVIAPDKSLVGVNKKFYETYKLTSKELLGKKCFQTFLYKDTPCNSDDCPISKVIKNKT